MDAPVQGASQSLVQQSVATQKIQPACWRDIGILGDATCPELQKFIHCRNCPVFSQASLELLNRMLPADYRREWTEHFTRSKELAAPTNASALIFRISHEWLALPTHVFQEVAERRSIHSLPHRRKGVVLGLVNVRGELLVCVSLGGLLGIEDGPARSGRNATYHRLLVANWGGHRFAFPVDEVEGTHRLHLDHLRPPPGSLAPPNTSFTEGMFLHNGRTVGYLKADLVFSTLNRSLA